MDLDQLSTGVHSHTWVKSDFPFLELKFIISHPALWNDEEQTLSFIYVAYFQIFQECFLISHSRHMLS